jgi:uncharacterized membrane protein YhaH (DUF805 family)
MDEYEQTWSSGGRIPRSVYWTRWALASALTFLVQLLFSFSPNALTLCLLLVVSLPMTVFIIIQGIKRMHDVNKSGWFILIPVYNLILAFTDGTPARNQFGPDPKERSESLMCSTCNTLNDPKAEVCVYCLNSLNPSGKSIANTTMIDNLLMIIISFFAFRAVVSFLIENFVENWFLSPMKYVYITLNMVFGVTPVVMAFFISNSRLRIAAIILATLGSLHIIVSNIKWLLQ